MNTPPRIAVNGLGRMGKLFVRALFDAGLGDQLVLLNNRSGDAVMHAHLLEFDTVHGCWHAQIEAKKDVILIDGQAIPLRNHTDLSRMELEALGVDLVVECTGAFKSRAKLQPYLDQGVKRVLVSAPVKEESVLNLVYGVNESAYDPTRHDIITAASCTTNCLAPVVQVIHETFGIKHGSITTIHDVTNSQVIIDSSHKDLRRARSALNSLIPTSTGSASAVGLIFPELQGRLNGLAVRVPLLNASLTDCVFEVERETHAEEVNAALKAAAQSGPLKGVLGYEEKPLVSADYVNDPRSSIVDASSTLVVNGTQVKIYAWYDNEWGYVKRMTDLVRMIWEKGV